MDDKVIGALSAGAVIVGLAVMRALPPAAAARVQEGAKWFVAAIFLAWGATIAIEDGEPAILIAGAVIIAAWLGRRLLLSHRRALQTEPRPPVRRERSG